MTSTIDGATGNMETNTFLYYGTTFQREKGISTTVRGIISAEKPTDALELLAHTYGAQLYYAEVWSIKKPEDPNRARYLSPLALAIEIAIAEECEPELSKLAIRKGIEYSLSSLVEYYHEPPTIEILREDVWKPVEELSPEGWVSLEQRVEERTQATPQDENQGGKI